MIWSNDNGATVVERTILKQVGRAFDGVARKLQERTDNRTTSGLSPKVLCGSEQCVQFMKTKFLPFIGIAAVITVLGIILIRRLQN